MKIKIKDYSQPLLTGADSKNQEEKVMALLAKGIESVAELSFGGAFVWYLVKYIIFAVVAFLGIKTGIALRKNKDAKEGK